MSRLRVLTALTTLCVVLAVSPWCFAESISLLSSSGGLYNYGLTVPANETVSFAHNAEITLSGLSGVTAAAAFNSFFPSFTVSSFAPSSVVFAETGNPSGFSIANKLPSPFTFGTLVVESSVLTLGTVDFSMQTTAGTITGTTQGPVAAVPVPEPAGLMLLGTGLLGLVGLARRTWSR